MDNIRWLAENWFTLLSAAGIVGGLIFDGTTRLADTRTSRIANQISLVGAHREIWKEFVKQPALHRILDAKANITAAPITPEEEVFVNLVIQHLDSVFYAMQDRLTINLEGLRRDVAWFFSLPIPEAVWEKLKMYQNARFIAFVDGSERNDE